MSSDIRNQISSAEERLRLAMLTSDYRALDELISSEWEGRGSGTTSSWNAEVATT
jgi:hypothetical protein